MTKSILILWALFVAYADISAKKIPNLLSLGGGIIGVCWLIVTGHTLAGQSWQSAALGLILALLLTMPGYITRTLGAGDVKLLSAIGLLCGLQIVAEVFIVAAAAAGLAALVYLYWRRYTYRPQARKPIPFGAALAAGLILALMRPDYLGLGAWLA